MKSVSKGVNWRTVALTATGGGAVMFLAVQILAKPGPTVQAATAGRRGGLVPASASNRTAGRAVTPPDRAPAAPDRAPAAVEPTPAEDTAPTVPHAASEAARSDAGAKLALVKDPTVRELFRPLVVPPKPGAKPGAGASGSIPTLPPAGGAGSTPPTKPSTSPPATPVTPAPPPGPSTGDLRLLGVVEMDGKPQVLLKKSTTGESRYFAKGDDAFGFKVGEIRSDGRGFQVALVHDGKSNTISMIRDVAIESSAGTSMASSGFGGGFGRGGFGQGGFGRGGFGQGGFGQGGFGQGGSGQGGYGRGGGSNGDRGSFGRGERGERGSRGEGGERGGSRERGGGGERGSGGGSTASSGFTTAEIMTLPTWTERLKKLEEVKGQMDAAQYERLKTFMSARAKTETRK